MMIEDENELPRDLEGVDRELSGIRIEERPSFAPELRSELESAAATPVSVRRRQRRLRRVAIAAGTVALLAAVSVPGARAALIRVWEVVRTPNAPLAEAAPADPVGPPLPLAHFVPLDETEDVPAEPTSTPAWTARNLDEIRPTFAYPRLLDADEAERIITMFYPSRLQQRGIGGSVRVMLWVDEDGTVQDRQVLESSGEPSLDRAALNATGRLRFEPARRQGVPVGSWVKFNIQFQPPDLPGVFRPSIYEDDSDRVETPSDRVADTAGRQPGN